MTTLEILPDAEEEITEIIETRNAIAREFNKLVVDCSGDELSEGGQSLKELERLEKFSQFLLTLPQGEAQTFHYFEDGVYMRVMHAPRDSVLIGCLHHESSINICLAGVVLTVWNGVVQEIHAPWIGTCGARTQKASIVMADLIWATLHPNPTNERCIEKLDARLHVRPTK